MALTEENYKEISTSDNIIMIKNSDIIKKTLFTLISVASSKSSNDYAWSIIKSLLKELKGEFDFLKYIIIDDVENLKNTIDDIKVQPDFNKTESKKLGKAIQKIVDMFKTRMGNKAGYFFLKEFRDKLGEDYHSVIKNIGVDLRLIDIQKDLYSVGGAKYKIKDDSSSNIGFIEKIE